MNKLWVTHGLILICTGVFLFFGKVSGMVAMAVMHGDELIFVIWTMMHLGFYACAALSMAYQAALLWMWITCTE